MHGITISDCRRILALAIGGMTPFQRPELWQDRLKSKALRRRRIARQRREHLASDIRVRDLVVHFEKLKLSYKPQKDSEIPEIAGVN